MIEFSPYMKSFEMHSKYEHKPFNLMFPPNKSNLQIFLTNTREDELPLRTPLLSFTILGISVCGICA